MASSKPQPPPGPGDDEEGEGELSLAVGKNSMNGDVEDDDVEAFSPRARARRSCCGARRPFCC